MRIEVILWGLIAISGLALATVESIVAYGNLTFLNENDYNGKRRIVAMGHWRRQVLQAVSFALFLSTGIGAILQWPRGATVSMLILGTALLVLNSWLDRRDRQRLIRWWMNVDLSHATARDVAVKNTTDSLARIEEGNRLVAENLAESQERADETEGEAGEAADAASRSPENGGR